MKTNTAHADSTSHTFLTGAILFANLDYSGFGSYAIKAAIAGAIWMLFKLTGDFLSEKIIKTGKKKKEEKHLEEEEN